MKIFLYTFLILLFIFYILTIFIISMGYAVLAVRTNKLSEIFGIFLIIGAYITRNSIDIILIFFNNLFNIIIYNLKFLNFFFYNNLKFFWYNKNKNILCLKNIRLTC